MWESLNTTTFGMLPNLSCIGVPFWAREASGGQLFIHHPNCSDFVCSPPLLLFCCSCSTVEQCYRGYVRRALASGKAGSRRQRSTVNQFVARIHSCETARDMRETAVSHGGDSRETARDSARQRETAARQPRILRESVQRTRCI